MFTMVIKSAGEQLLGVFKGMGMDRQLLAHI